MRPRGSSSPWLGGAVPAEEMKVGVRDDDFSQVAGVAFEVGFGVAHRGASASSSSTTPSTSRRAFSSSLTPWFQAIRRLSNRAPSRRQSSAVPAKGLELKNGYDAFCGEVGVAFEVGFRVTYSDTRLLARDCAAPIVETGVVFFCALARRSGQRVVRHDAHPTVGEKLTSSEISARIGGRCVRGQLVWLDPSTVDSRCGRWTKGP
jgi:hypothetical protein